MPTEIEIPVASHVEYTAVDTKPAGFMDHFATSRNSSEKITLGTHCHSPTHSLT
jgi:hypothetical protein